MAHDRPPSTAGPSVTLAIPAPTHQPARPSLASSQSPSHPHPDLTSNIPPQPKHAKLTIRGLLTFPYRLCNPPPAVGKVRSCQVTPVFKIQLDDVLNRRHLPPLGLKDFEEWLLFVEHKPQNLYFILWLREYTAKYEQFALSTRSRSRTTKLPPPRHHKPINSTYRTAFPTHTCPNLALFYARAKQTFFTPGSPYELTEIPHDLLLPLFQTGVALQHPALPRDNTQHPDPTIDPNKPLPHHSTAHPDPAIFASIEAHVMSLLKDSLHRFVMNSYHNVGSRRAICGIIAGIFCSIVGFIPPLAVNFRNAGNRWMRLAAVPGLWLGLTLLISSLHGVCMMIYVFGDLRQLRKFELIRPSISQPRPIDEEDEDEYDEDHDEQHSSEGSLPHEQSPTRSNPQVSIPSLSITHSTPDVSPVIPSSAPPTLVAFTSPFHTTTDTTTGPVALAIPPTRPPKMTIAIPQSNTRRSVDGGAAKKARAVKPHASGLESVRERREVIGSRWDEVAPGDTRRELQDEPGETESMLRVKHHHHHHHHTDSIDHFASDTDSLDYDEDEDDENVIEIGAEEGYRYAGDSESDHGIIVSPAYHPDDNDEDEDEDDGVAPGVVEGGDAQQAQGDGTTAGVNNAIADSSVGEGDRGKKKSRLGSRDGASRPGSSGRGMLRWAPLEKDKDKAKKSKSGKKTLSRPGSASRSRPSSNSSSASAAQGQGQGQGQGGVFEVQADVDEVVASTATAGFIHSYAYTSSSDEESSSEDEEGVVESGEESGGDEEKVSGEAKDESPTPSYRRRPSLREREREREGSMTTTTVSLSTHDEKKASLTTTTTGDLFEGDADDEESVAHGLISISAALGLAGATASPAASPATVTSPATLTTAKRESAFGAWDVGGDLEKGLGGGGVRTKRKSTGKTKSRSRSKRYRLSSAYRRDSSPDGSGSHSGCCSGYGGSSCTSASGEGGEKNRNRRRRRSLSFSRTGGKRTEKERETMEREREAKRSRSVSYLTSGFGQTHGHDCHHHHHHHAHGHGHGHAHYHHHHSRQSAQSRREARRARERQRLEEFDFDKLPPHPGFLHPSLTRRDIIGNPATHGSEGPTTTTTMTAAATGMAMATTTHGAGGERRRERNARELELRGYRSPLYVGERWGDAVAWAGATGAATGAVGSGGGGMNVETHARAFGVEGAEAGNRSAPARMQGAWVEKERIVGGDAGGRRAQSDKDLEAGYGVYGHRAGGVEAGLGSGDREKTEEVSQVAVPQQSQDPSQQQAQTRSQNWISRALSRLHPRHVHINIHLPYPFDNISLPSAHSCTHEYRHHENARAGTGGGAASSRQSMVITPPPATTTRGGGISNFIPLSLLRSRTRTIPTDNANLDITTSAQHFTSYTHARMEDADWSHSYYNPHHSSFGFGYGDDRMTGSWRTRFAAATGVAPFGPVTRVLSPVVSRAQWEVVVRSTILAGVATWVVIGALLAVPEMAM